MNTILPKISLFIFLIISSHSIFGQTINGYAKVTNISGATLTLSTVDESADTFEDDEWIVIMQMQGDVIGTTTNVATFGDLGSIGSTGLYEVRQIDSHTETAGIPSTVTLKNVPGNAYSTCANCSVQIITFRSLGSPDYTTTADISCLPWDGDIGGVVAMYVEGTLTLAHNVGADAVGFRGGAVSNNFNGPICNAASVTRYREDNGQLGFKGEGIYKNLTNTYNNARGHLLNGGGGGSNHNGGGAGGGNFTQGGQGGNGWNNCTTNPAGGLGGISLSTEIGGNRIFMGGGGGGGQQNNSQSRAGGAGGGIVLIRANEITTGTCGGVSISANGTGPLSSGTNDGGGGGGAGGSVVFWVENWTVDPGCPLTISSNGGDGSSSLSGGSHAGGGGGGQGVIIFQDAEPTSNITTETNNGVPGCGNTSSPCNSLAGAPSGTDNSGIFSGTTNPLPIELIAYHVSPFQERHILVEWTTASERDNAYFTIERSVDGQTWEIIGKVNGAGNSSETIAYSFVDSTPYFGLSYYRLTQTDFDGSAEQVGVRHVILSTDQVALFPNPTASLVHIMKPDVKEITVYDAQGKKYLVQSLENTNALSTFSIEHLPSGIYMITFSSQGNLYTEKLSIVKG